MPVERAECRLLRQIELLRALGDKDRDDDGKRQRAQRDERHDRADEQHHEQHADNRDDGGDGLREAVLQSGRDEVDVVDDAREDVTLRMRVVIGQRDAVELLLGLLT